MKGIYLQVPFFCINYSLERHVAGKKLYLIGQGVYLYEEQGQLGTQEAQQ